MDFTYLKILFLSLLLIVLTSMPDDIGLNGEYTLLTNTTDYSAVDDVILEFNFTKSPEAHLYCSNSYGTVVLKPEVRDNIMQFEIPKTLTIKSGIISWQLISQVEPLKGQIDIRPDTIVKSIESYLGPPSIQAGGTDFSMLVVIPTDENDNPLVDSTAVTVKHQFLSKRDISTINTQHGVGYITIYSTEQNGRILVSSECLGLNSKEFDINVLPSIPGDFEITSDRIHKYADGNQVATFKTSIIKDRFENIVSDGTLVSFYITDQNGRKSTFTASTINGIATGKIIHPDRQTDWKIRAYVEGMASSNSLEINFEQAVSDFDVKFSSDKRTIKVGPLRSFMKQRIPDGLSVKLLIYRDDLLLNEIINSSIDGAAIFRLKPDRYPKGPYRAMIELAGIKKTFNDLILD